MAAKTPARCWLMKCEPSAYTIDGLERDGRTSWEGVRNFQARNFMRDEMKVGDPVLFYASNADPSGVTGLATIAREGYPDPFATKKGHKYFDEDSKADAPTWYMVDIAFGLEKMVVTQKGSRLSVQPVTPAEYDIVVRLGRSGAVVRGEAGGTATRTSAARAPKGTRKRRHA
jgi:predicted RNA-binding protein with PUA-like domain